MNPNGNPYTTLRKPPPKGRWLAHSKFVGFGNSRRHRLAELLRLGGPPMEDVAVEEDGCHGRSQVAPVEKSSSSFAALIATPANIPFRAWGPLAGARRATVWPWRVISISSPRSTSSSNANNLAFTSVAVICLVIWSVYQKTSVGWYRKA